MIHIVIGTKAQLIKMAPVMSALRNAGLSYRYISTGQHRETMEEILNNFGLKGPDITLYSGPDITSIPKMLVWALRILWHTFKDRKRIFENDRKGIVLVHGDTFSTLLGALMGKAARLKVGHVESGLRSYNLFHPFPEEITRLLTFALADYYFCPGTWAIKNLERYKGVRIDMGANTLLDALEMAKSKIANISVDIPEEPYAIATLHRFENVFSKPALERLVDIVGRIAESKKVVFILHKPTFNKLKEFNLYDILQSHPRVELRPRYDYFRFIKLIDSADFVISDGGSNQEECFYLGKPILLLRQATEREEGLDVNCVLSRYDYATIKDFTENFQRFQRPPFHPAISPSDRIALECVAFQ
ncbi:UDP-N-acetylglucosamine 2-epimerase (non-hydrolysing) [Novimethylophilus kurashikiensis]|uniref:UDP-N-acetylglucosamine 2-epimerase (Non-hydrolysing) n=1 Tax=Novimethylophilus kurashikiensis TaxID=1825523 RepID=A0A2R5FCT8_9PROT|nr:UDP-N-acetylglucosamine 2-epimerase [Novimethylophilus kurashikiensis]GBG15669.1 UDP-N-acetylglucosamine 2-epimerase (non-hydrolysing) [Novimethylophilus kurashikiensis]